MSSQFSYSQGIHEIQWHGRDVWLIIESWGELVVAKMGAQVLHYQPVGEQAVFWLNTHTGPLSKGYHDQSSCVLERDAVRAGAPLCWPWFGPHENDPCEPNHGFARITDWQLQSSVLQSATGDITKLRFSPSTVISMALTVAFEIEVHHDQLLMRIETANYSSTDQPLTQAIHSYFSVADNKAVEVLGLNSCEYIDKLLNNTRAKQKGELANIDAIDSIYIHDGAVVLIDKQYQRKLIIGKEGSASTVVWNPGNAFKQYNILQESRKFICVEAANTAHEELVLSPGQKVSLMQSIKIEALYEQ
jgi:glucose-6-phosphate 1-epimerase